MITRLYASNSTYMESGNSKYYVRARKSKAIMRLILPSSKTQ
jgi:hypothetical protein